MNQQQHVKDILVAISSVKSRVREAQARGDMHTYNILCMDLLALEQCLVYQTEAMIAAAA
jgi:hypothetical protein